MVSRIQLISIHPKVKISLHTQHKVLTLNNHELHTPNQIWVENIYYIILNARQKFQCYI